MKSFPPAVLAAAIVAASADAAANEVYDAYFAKRGTACYARSYDGAHLQRHPRQKVQRIELAFKGDKKATPRAFELRLGLAPKNGKERFSRPANCSAEGNGILCRLESDGGTFRLGPAPRGALVLQVVGDGLRMEGATGFIEVGGKTSDDNRFDLSPTQWQFCPSARRG